LTLTEILHVAIIKIGVGHTGTSSLD